MTFGYDPNKTAKTPKLVKKDKSKMGSYQGKQHYGEMTINDVLKLPCIAVPQQNISEEDAEFYGIRSATCEKDGETVTDTYFPYYTQEGKLTGFKSRDWELPKEDDNHFAAVGSLKASNMLFGQPQCKASGKKLVYVEGEGDCVAARRAILDSLKGGKWEGKIEPNVVSLNMGCASAAQSTAHNENFIRSFTQVVLAFDNDEATIHETKKGIRKGKESLEEVAGFLLTENLYTISWPTDVKDAREMYSLGRGKEFADLVSFSALKYSPEKIVSGDDVTLDELIQPLRKGLYLDRFPKLMEKIKGLRVGGELITYAAMSGVGKSTLAREFAYGSIAAGRTVGHIFLEETRIKTQQALLCLELGIMLPEFRENPLAYASREQIAEAKAKILSNGKTYFLDHFGSLQVDKLMTQIKYLHHICGCDDIYLDHVSMVIAGLSGTNERKDLDMLYEALAAFVTVNPCTIHAVCHLKRVEDSKAAKVDQDDPQPYWREVRKEMLRGSAGIEQMSSMIIMIENQIMPDGTRGLIRTRVEKNREWSHLGICDTMTMKEDGRLYCVEEEEDLPYTGGNSIKPKTNAFM